MWRGDRYVYEEEEVARLLGIEGGVSALDILAWLRDPGGSRVWQQRAAQLETAKTSWMARRGPINPESDLACDYFDLTTTMRRLRQEAEISPAEHAVACLSVMGMSPIEIAQVVDFAGPRNFKALEARRKRVTRMLVGSKKYDKDGQEVLDKGGRPVRAGGLVKTFTQAMNNGGRP